MNNPISLKDFKDWFEKETTEFLITRQDPNAKHIGKIATSKVSEKKLMEKIETKGDSSVLVSEFFHKGGEVVSINGLQVNIKTESGTFDLPMFCLKINR